MAKRKKTFTSIEKLVDETLKPPIMNKHKELIPIPCNFNYKHEGEKYHIYAAYVSHGNMTLLSDKYVFSFDVSYKKSLMPNDKWEVWMPNDKWEVWYYTLFDVYE